MTLPIASAAAAAYASGKNCGTAVGEIATIDYRRRDGGRSG